ncbi:GTPase-activating protein and VPS9 domain-containing protein 1-like isoform X2 [Amphiura filiformis]|uniref:GTPase-activating protein and VPS9 domain-containing protein 1-like isoform X2 n=1 Tax=Amphiura filiformis TaxID=82378 RepID=UPI003B2152B3
MAAVEVTSKCNPTMTELVQLAKHLKQERLFVQSEKLLLMQIHEDVTQTADKLFRLSWVTRQQRQTLNSLCLASADAPPNVCCYRANALESVDFIDSYGTLGSDSIFYGELLGYLRENPKLLGQCLALGEREGVENTKLAVHTVMSAVYANCVVQVDERNALFLLQSLMEHQLSSSDDPRRLLRKGRCAFSQAFKLFTENLFASRLYLTAALHEPIMGVLMEDEKCLETNPQKALAQFTAEEIVQRFGTLGTDEYHQKLSEYLELVNDQLVALCNRFMTCLKTNSYCFPQSLDWIISQLHKILSKSEHIDQTELRAMCADLLMVHFICPAIVDPEPYGITSDVMISKTARTNLMQVGQILQGLALQTGAGDDQAKSNTLYSKFPKGCMSSFLDVLIDNMSASDAPPASIQLQGMARSSALITNTELENLVAFLRAVTASNPDSGEFEKLVELLSALPAPSPPVKSDPVSPLEGSSPKGTTGLTPPNTPPVMHSKKTGTLAQKMSSSMSKKMGRQMVKEEEDGPEVMSPDPMVVTQPEDVLVLTFDNGGNECPGMMQEHKILSSVPERQQPSDETDSEKSNKSSNMASISEIQGKHLRFSTRADPIDASSTCASNSIYSMDLEGGEKDSILSGRQTPRSTVSIGSSTTEQLRPDLIDPTQLSNSTNITDRFGKFEIGPMDNKRASGQPDPMDTRSDTWSTDVCGSDSEPPSEANPNDRLQEITEVQQEEGEVAGAGGIAMPNLLDPLETASETWSVDALQSDSEHPNDRLQEVEEVPQEELVHTLSLEGDQSSSKASEGGRSSRRSSCESHSMGRSSNNGSPGVDDFAKKDGGSDEGSSGQFFDSSDNPSLLKGSSTEDSASSSVGADGSTSGLLPVITHNQSDMNRPLMPDRFKSNQSVSSVKAGGNVLNQFDPFGTTSVSAPSPAPVTSSTSVSTLAAMKTRNGSSPQNNQLVDNLLSDFDPFATGPSSNLFTPRFPVHDQMLNNNRPLGAKPKVKQPMNRAPMFQPQSIGTAGNPMFHSNQGFDDNFTPPPPVQRQNPFDITNSSISHVNHGFFDMDSQLDPFQSDIMNAFTTQNSTPSAFSSSSLNNSSKTNGSAFRGLGDNLRDSGVVPGSLSSQEHLSQRTDSSLSTSSSGNVSFLTSSQDSSTITDGTAQMSSTNPDGIEGLGNQHNTSTLSLGALPSHMEAEKVPNGGVRSTSVDSSVAYSAETLALYGEKLQDGDRQNSKWADRKKSFFKAINKISTKKPPKESQNPNIPRLDRREQDMSLSRGAGTPERKDSDPIRIVANPALVEPFEDDVMKSSSVPVASSEDILNKYRGLRRAQSTDNIDGDGTTQNDGEQPLESSTDESVSKPDSTSSEPLYLDPDNVESCYAFSDAKRKLRIVLRSADFQTLPWLCNFSQQPLVKPQEVSKDSTENDNDRRDAYPENELVAFLKVQLAEAMNLEDKSLIAQLRETLRCVQNFDNEGCKKLLASLRDDYERRTPYIAYLIRSRKGLVSSRAHLERLLNRIQRDKETVNKYFTMVCVRLFLERQEPSIQKFITDFKALTAADEKTQLVMYYIGKLNKWIQNDPIWQAASETQKLDAGVATERAIMSRIYNLALYPNGDGDILRDQLLHEHIHRLTKVVTASHRALQISEKYRRESPWPAAQAEILNINVYKTPKDKLQCISRCCNIILNLLRMGSDHPPGADDFLPVLMFVLIKANPPCLLSTVQYVNSFYYENPHYSSTMSGEEQYYWMQFCAAIEYIKTIDDRR